MLRAGWGERKRERAGNDGPPRACYFFDYCYFYRDTQREPLRRREGKKIVACGHRRISSRRFFLPGWREATIENTSVSAV